MQHFHRLPAQTIPLSPKRIVLINPTRFLGNLLIAGNLIQHFTKYCKSRQIDCLLVFDESFRELLQDAFQDVPILYYPRQAIKNAGALQKLRLTVQVIRKIRAYRPDLAFNIEEDGVSSYLTQTSGAGFRLGCSPSRHRRFYEAVLPIDYTSRPAGREHRWHSYYEVFKALGMPQPEPAYLKLPHRTTSQSLQMQLEQIGVDTGRPLIALHPGATKDYKKWPAGHYLELAILLIKKGYFPVFIGAGKTDSDATNGLMKSLADQGYQGLAANLCGRLSLAELATFFTCVSAVAGNDSGPFHLASAMGTHGVVIFGPSDSRIWKPLEQTGHLMQKSSVCDPGCSRRQCLRQHACLSAITPPEVLNKILEIQ